MQSPTHAYSCANPHTSCQGPCTGFGTQAACPPLIVLAVLSTQQTPASAAATA
jgi:hypothetical protein